MDPRIPRETFEFLSEMPAVAPPVLRPGAFALDEGTYTCVRCNVPGNEVSLLPGENLPECFQCGEDSLWAKI